MDSSRAGWEFRRLIRVGVSPVVALVLAEHAPRARKRVQDAQQAAHRARGRQAAREGRGGPIG